MLHRIAGLGRQLLNEREARRKDGEFPAITLLLILLLVLLGIMLLWFKWPASQNTAIVCSRTIVNNQPSPSPSPTAKPLGAYELWLAMNNTGTEADFFDALVGKPGKDGYVGSNGLTGADGKTGSTGAAGLSAYQLWLNDGHTGSSQDFINSLTGAAGVNGLSAYELWLAQGNTGTAEDFFNSLAGVPGAAGSKGNKGDQGLSAYAIWLKNGNTGTESDFLVSLVGHDGVDGAPGVCSVGETGASGAAGAPGTPGLSAYEVWLKSGHVGSEEVFLASLVGPSGEPGAVGPTGATGNAGPPGIGGLGYSGSFWDDTIQGGDGLLSTGINTAYPIYFSEADTANNAGVSVVRCAGDAARPDGYPALPKSCITFTHAGVYNIAFSAQLYRTSGGSEDVYSFWLRADGQNVPDTNTDITLISNGQKQVAAWNFFVPVSCNGSCTTYQLMWSFSGSHSNLWYEGPQTSPARPAIPSIIMTVNQVR